MTRLIKALLSIAVRNELCLRFLDRTLVRAGRYVEVERHRAIRSGSTTYDILFDRFARYTRLPREYFCSNLRLVEKYRDLQGSVVECGVWRGGMSAGMACTLGDYRDYYLFDSFEGLPAASEIDGQRALEWQANNDVNNCRTDESFAHEAMTLAGVNRFNVVKGWFNQTLPTFQPTERIAVLRLDADWYSSTADCLNYLYAQVVPNGLIILDDYYAWDGCSKALHDFLSVNKLRDRIQQYDSMVCYLTKAEDIPIKFIDPNGHESITNPQQENEWGR